MTPYQIEKMCEDVANRTVNKTFLALGVNIDDPKEVTKFQRDLSHLRMWRESTEAVSRRGLLTVVTVLVTAGVGWLLTYFFKWNQ